MTNIELIETLKKRFLENMHRHEGIEWSDVQKRFEASEVKLRSLIEMERTGGEPDVVSKDSSTGAYVFMDCSEETPEGRRNICYDRKGQEERNKKGIFPNGNAVDMAAEMGIELLSEDQYRYLQSLGNFDKKTSSWIKTPPEIRKLGGAIFADYRYGQVFVYHNSAPSFYSSRAFRGALIV